MTDRICEYCGKVMVLVDDCTANRAFQFTNGQTIASVLYNDHGLEGTRCRDCGVAWGNHHHPGCEMECCPICYKQLLSCGHREDIEFLIPAPDHGE